RPSRQPGAPVAGKSGPPVCRLRPAGDVAGEHHCGPAGVFAHLSDWAGVSLSERILRARQRGGVTRDAERPTVAPRPAPRWAGAWLGGLADLLGRLHVVRHRAALSRHRLWARASFAG